MRASLNGPDVDPGLPEELRASGDAHALALWARSPGEAEPLLARSAASGNRVGALGRAAVLADLGRVDEAVQVLRGLLADLDTRPTLSPNERDSVPYPARFDHLRVGWEQAAFEQIFLSAQTGGGDLRFAAKSLFTGKQGFQHADGGVEG